MNSLRIALHLGTLRGFGTGVVGRGVLEGLAQVAGAHRFLAYVPREWGLRGTPGIEVRPTRPGIVHKLLSENLTIRRALGSWRADRLFSLGDTSLPACPVPHLLFVQQPYLAYPPEEWGFTPPPLFRAKMAAMAAYLRATLPTVGLVAVQGEAMKARFAERWGFPPERIRIVPSAIFAPPGAEAPPDGPPYLAYVASASPQKDHAVLAPMMAALRARWPELKCRVTVTPKDVPALAAAAERLGVTPAIDFVGPLPRLAAVQLLAGAAVVVGPSRLESFGLPYFEALALGRPQVASDRPFAREACGDAALYAQQGDGEAFAAAVDRVLTSPELASDLGDRARRRFSRLARGWDVVARDFVGLLEEL